MSNVITRQMMVVPLSAMKKSQITEKVALFGPDGEPMSVVQVPATMVLTGYTMGASSAAVAATDTLNVAIGKLENQIADSQPNTAVLTGFVAGSPLDLAATDTILEAFEKVQGLIFNHTSRIETLEAAIL